MHILHLAAMCIIGPFDAKPGQLKQALEAAARKLEAVGADLPLMGNEEEEEEGTQGQVQAEEEEEQAEQQFCNIAADLAAELSTDERANLAASCLPEATVLTKVRRLVVYCPARLLMRVHFGYWSRVGVAAGSHISYSPPFPPLTLCFSCWILTYPICSLLRIPCAICLLAITLVLILRMRPTRSHTLDQTHRFISHGVPFVFSYSLSSRLAFTSTFTSIPLCSINSVCAGFDLGLTLTHLPNFACSPACDTRSSSPHPASHVPCPCSTPHPHFPSHAPVSVSFSDHCISRVHLARPSLSAPPSSVGSILLDLVQSLRYHASCHPRCRLHPDPVRWSCDRACDVPCGVVVLLLPSHPHSTLTISLRSSSSSSLALAFLPFSSHCTAPFPGVGCAGLACRPAALSRATDAQHSLTPLRITTPDIRFAHSSPNFAALQLFSCLTTRHDVQQPASQSRRFRLTARRGGAQCIRCLASPSSTGPFWTT